MNRVTRWDLIRWLLFALVALVMSVLPVHAQQLTSSEETITVSTTTVGITADLCDTGNRGGAWVQVLTNGIYFSTNDPNKTVDSGDFTLNSGTTGPQFHIKPARLLRMIRQSADSSVKITCTD